MPELLSVPSQVDMIGYVASLLVLLTFTMRSMFCLRIFGLASNLAFVSYAILADLPPIFMLHIVLLAINAVRLNELRRETGTSFVQKEEK